MPRSADPRQLRRVQGDGSVGLRAGLDIGVRLGPSVDLNVNGMMARSAVHSGERSSAGSAAASRSAGITSFRLLPADQRLLNETAPMSRPSPLVPDDGISVHDPVVPGTNPPGPSPAYPPAPGSTYRFPAFPARRRHRRPPFLRPRRPRPAERRADPPFRRRLFRRRAKWRASAQHTRRPLEPACRRQPAEAFADADARLDDALIEALACTCASRCCDAATGLQRDVCICETAPFRLSERPARSRQACSIEPFMPHGDGEQRRKLFVTPS